MIACKTVRGILIINRKINICFLFLFYTLYAFRNRNLCYDLLSMNFISKCKRHVMISNVKYKQMYSVKCRIWSSFKIQKRDGKLSIIP